MTRYSDPPVAGVIGDPIGHSRSPALHGHWLRRYGITGHYVPLRVAAADLPQSIAALGQLGFRGVNVTIPHKEAALRLADHASSAARSIGAANLVLFQPDGTIRADNTDGAGFLAHLRLAAPDWRPDQGPVLILGAGGAARSIAHALIDAGAPLVRIANRTASRADTLADALGPAALSVGWPVDPQIWAASALIINTTSLGMQGQPALPIEADTIGPGKVVADIVYAPLETPLLAAARARGAVAVDGLGMLLHQAVPAFEGFFGHRPVVDAALRAAVLGR
jgi:shikimate dehydrogenase